jgi:hypothetical protein
MAQMLIKANKARAAAPPLRSAAVTGCDGALWVVRMVRSFLVTPSTKVVEGHRRDSGGPVLATAALIVSGHDVIELLAKPCANMFGHGNVAPPVALAVRGQDGSKITSNSFKSGHGLLLCFWSQNLSHAAKR